MSVGRTVGEDAAVVVMEELLVEEASWFTGVVRYSVQGKRDSSHPTQVTAEASLMLS
jgi:hypothetical protein